MRELFELYHKKMIIKRVASDMNQVAVAFSLLLLYKLCSEILYDIREQYVEPCLQRLGCVAICLIVLALGIRDRHRQYSSLLVLEDKSFGRGIRRYGEDPVCDLGK